jgi:zinc-binding alcohol dehydrogenase family protein
VTGYDCAGVVESVGPEATLFKVGDEVFYAGAVQRRGTNAEFHAVDERIVGHKPKNVTFAQAAAVPLVFLTAWEGMVENMHIAPGSGAGRPILIVAGAGGVGSVATQIAKNVLGLTVIATASRPASVAFCKAHGADFVIDHTKPLKPQIEALGFPGGVDFTLCCTDLDLHFDGICEASAPRASICGITMSDASKISVFKLFVKRLSLSMELMFTRPLLQTADMEEQHAILDRAAALIEGGAIVSTMTQEAPFTLEALKAAHAAQEAGSMLGKQVLTWAE